MIPATNVCPDSWHREYHGYIMSTHYTNPKSEFVCFDDDIQSLGTISSTSYWYRAAVNTVPGTPSQYKNARELTCVVCTK